MTTFCERASHWLRQLKNLFFKSIIPVGISDPKLFQHVSRFIAKSSYFLNRVEVPCIGKFYFPATILQVLTSGCPLLTKTVCKTLLTSYWTLDSCAPITPHNHVIRASLLESQTLLDQSKRGFYIVHSTSKRTRLLANASLFRLVIGHQSPLLNVCRILADTHLPELSTAHSFCTFITTPSRLLKMQALLWPLHTSQWCTLSHLLALCFCPLGEFHAFDASIAESVRASSPSLRQLNDTDDGARKFTLDFVGTPGISKRLGQKGYNKD